MNKAFTMIELIFVIVILGILAAVAIPKLSATRDDAILAKISQSMATASTEIASYAISQGEIEADLSLMSNGIKGMVDRGDATLDIPNKSVDFQMGSNTDCLTFIVYDGALDANLSLVYGAGPDSLCSQLQLIFDAREYPIPLRGQRVSF